jgi:hypothetical protein
MLLDCCWSAAEQLGHVKSPMALEGKVKEAVGVLYAAGYIKQVS